MNLHDPVERVVKIARRHRVVLTRPDCLLILAHPRFGVVGVLFSQNTLRSYLLDPTLIAGRHVFESYDGTPQIVNRNPRLQRPSGIVSSRLDSIQWIVAAAAQLVREMRSYTSSVCLLRKVGAIIKRIRLGPICTAPADADKGSSII